MKDQQHITIQIAGQPPIGIEIPREKQAWMRKVERNVNHIWAKWCDDFRDKDPQEVLAMVTFQYARFYYDLLDKVNENRRAIEDFEQKLDSILLDVE